VTASNDEKKAAAVDELTAQQIQAVIECEHRALTDFCERVLPLYRGIAYSRLVAANQHSRAKQQDLVQSLIEATLSEEIVSKWKSAKGLLSSYLRVFAKRRALDILESKAGRSCEKLMDDAELAVASDANAVREATTSPEDRLFWQQIIREMRSHPDPEYRELFERHFLQGDSPEEAAQQMGKDVQTIYKRIQRMKKDIIALRDRLLRK
jgi:RNA polymerase sigma factor (sigma-70 family)